MYGNLSSFHRLCGTIQADATCTFKEKVASVSEYTSYTVTPNLPVVCVVLMYVGFVDGFRKWKGPYSQGFRKQKC